MTGCKAVKMIIKCDDLWIFSKIITFSATKTSVILSGHLLNSSDIIWYTWRIPCFLFHIWTPITCFLWDHVLSFNFSLINNILLLKFYFLKEIWYLQIYNPFLGIFFLLSMLWVVNVHSCMGDEVTDSTDI